MPLACNGPAFGPAEIIGDARPYNPCVLAELPYPVQVLLNLPHPLELVWLAWGCLVPWHLRYLLRKTDHAHQLSRTGELMNFVEIRAIGCVGGFILLTFIFLYCASLTLRLAGLL
jgi:hypothetical protein